MRHLASLILLYPTLTLATLDARWVDAAKQRGEVVDLTRGKIWDTRLSAHLSKQGVVWLVITSVVFKGQ